jgi:hypothetical protein
MAKRTSRPKEPETAGDQPVPQTKASTTRAKRGTPVEAKPVETPYEPTEDEIRHRAYERYLERGGGDGGDFDDWLHAQQDLRRKR